MRKPHPDKCNDDMDEEVKSPSSTDKLPIPDTGASVSVKKDLCVSEPVHRAPVIDLGSTAQTDV